MQQVCAAIWKQQELMLELTDFCFIMLALSAVKTIHITANPFEVCVESCKQRVREQGAWVTSSTILLGKGAEMGRFFFLLMFFICNCINHFHWLFIAFSTLLLLLLTN